MIKSCTLLLVFALLLCIKGANGFHFSRILRPSTPCLSSRQSQRQRHLAVITTNGNSDQFSSTSLLPSSSGSVSSSSPNAVDWIVYVDYSKMSMEKGAAATLDAFLSLTQSRRVQVKAAFLPKQTKSGGYPWIRCVSIQKSSAIELFGVDSVDKVYRVLTKHMQIEGISRRACRCLQYKYKANGFLEAGKVSLAIEAYQKALQSSKGDKQQEGVILFLRSAAYLQRAEQHRDELKDIVQELINMVPPPPKLVSLLDVAYYVPPLSGAVMRKILQDSEAQDRQFLSTQYRHGLYQYALLQAAQDALKATEVLPHYAAAWVRAADIMGELWKLPEAILYYERAIALDESLRPSLIPVVERLQRQQGLLAEARSYRWSEDTLRLALDVAG
uniref:Uncharacterized protein n=1 Tax=Amphora coffeiformis TaxID=265554 RepID=A0A7S3L8D0_9STRA